MSTNLETLENVWTSSPGGLVFAQYAEALLREGRGREAQSVLTEGLERWPRHFAGKLLLGRLHEEVGNLDAARAAYQDAVALDNNSPGALRSLALLLGKQQYQRQAIDLWVRLSLLDPNNPESAAAARKMIADLETTSSLADLGLGVRDIEDAASREALSEGTSSGFAVKGLSGLESNSPLAGWNSDGALGSPDPAFDLGDLAFPSPPSVATPTPAAASTANWSANTDLESGTHPMLDPMTESELSKPLLGPTEDSGFATLEMASFPARSIPPPPLELPRPLAAMGNESDTRIMSPVPPLVPPPTVVSMDEAEPAATQAMPRVQASAPVTGDDIGDRLDALFAESDVEPASMVETAEPVAKLPETPAPPVRLELPQGLATAPTSAMEIATKVSGEDVADRLSELFGSPSETAELIAPPIPEPPPSARQSTGVTRAAVTGNDIEARLDDLFGASEVDLPIVAPLEDEPAAAPSATVATETASAGVSGRDIEDRLDSLFGSEEEVRKDTLKASETSAMDRDSLFGDAPSETAEATLENMRAFETAAAPVVHGLSERPEETRAFDQIPSDSSTGETQGMLVAAIDPSDVDSGGSTLDLPTVGDLPSTPPPAATGRLTGQDLDSQLDELFASSEFLLDDAPAPSPRKATPTANGPVTGDDIGDRLDDLFGSDSDFPAGVPTVTLAEEYLRQGYRDQALAVYRQLATRDPSNTDINRRIAEIEAAGN